jgi:uncharacterized membrane protein
MTVLPSTVEPELSGVPRSRWRFSPHKSGEPLAVPAIRHVPVALAAAAVLAQIGYPLLVGSARDRLTVATVVLFFAASTSHALCARGARWTGVLVAVTAGGGLLAEAVGTRYGYPFGRYSYADSLGAKLRGVPLVIPLAWTMMAYPALLVGRLLAGPRRWAVPLVAGWALASWDLFLDPQMVAAGHWRWLSVGHALPGVPDVPVSNYVGWLAVAVTMMTVLATVLPSAPGTDDRLPVVLYLWTYASSVLANVALFGQPTVAVTGGLGMGLVAVPLALAVVRHNARDGARIVGRRSPCG